MISIDNYDPRQFARCSRCNGVVAKTDLGVDGICHACKTRRGSRWEMAEQKRMERAEREAQKVRVLCPACNREQVLIEDRKRCECGFILRKRMSTF